MARDDDGDDEVRDDRDTAAAGDVLGISRVPAGPTGEIHREKGSAGGEDDRHVGALEDETDLGARDVTRSESSTVTGGHGSTPQRSGADDFDLGGE